MPMLIPPHSKKDAYLHLQVFRNPQKQKGGPPIPKTPKTKAGGEGEGGGGGWGGRGEEMAARIVC